MNSATTLKELEENMENFSKQNKPSVEEIQEHLKKCKESLKAIDIISRVSKIQRNYSRLVNDYYTLQPPSFLDSIDPKSVENNILCYLELVIHTLRANDISILQHWGIDYPRQQNQKWLDDPSQAEHYVRRLQQDFREYHEAEKEYNYLVDHFKRVEKQEQP